MTLDGFGKAYRSVIALSESATRSNGWAEKALAHYAI